MMPDSAIQEALKGLKNVRWRETAFADLQWYYAEEGVYILRCKKGDPNEHLCVIRAKSADEAISRAVFNLYKADAKKKSAPVGDMAAIREALVGLTDGICFHCDMSGDCKGVPCEKMQKAKAALAKPARNCDVGTVEEQEERLKAFCCSHGTDIQGAPRCENCVLLKADGCELVWAQMPYEAGGISPFRLWKNQKN